MPFTSRNSSGNISGQCGPLREKTFTNSIFVVNSKMIVLRYVDSYHQNDYIPPPPWLIKKKQHGQSPL